MTKQHNKLMIKIDGLYVIPTDIVALEKREAINTYVHLSNGQAIVVNLPVERLVEALDIFVTAEIK